MEETDRKDPTFLLPEEPMSYELKPKKKKKKKKKHDEDDPFKDLDEIPLLKTCEFESVIEDDTGSIDPEVQVKVENVKIEDIKVDCDFPDYDFDGDASAPAEDPQDEPIIKIQKENKEGVLLTFESILQNKIVKVKKSSKVKVQKHLQCDICFMLFKTEHTLHTHKVRKHKISHKNLKYACSQCDSRYEHKNALTAHVRRRHGPNAVSYDNEFRACDICSLAFKGRMRLRMHMIRKHGIQDDDFKYECEFCNLKYSLHTSLETHLKRKHRKTVKVKQEPLKCPLCPKMLTNRETYARHLQRSHLNNKKPPSTIQDGVKIDQYYCQQCPAIFANILYLKLHMRRVHNEKKEEYNINCKICNISYDNVESLKRHVSRKHGMGTNDVKKEKNKDCIKECHICGLIFASKGGLTKHLRCIHKMHAGPKSFQCSFCKESYRYAKGLAQHIRRDHQKIRYPCKFCNKKFTCREYFRRHMINVHPEKYDSKETCVCYQCGKNLPNEMTLQKHLREHAKEVKQVKEEGIQIKKELEDEVQKEKQTYNCTKCSETRNTFNELRQHYEEKHYLSQDMQCQVCGEILPEKDLAKHMKTNHPVNTKVKCQYCEFVSTSRAKLSQHILRHKDVTADKCDHQGCRYKSYFPDAMEKHKKKHQFHVMLQCSYCPYQTMNKYSLRNHEEEHETGKKKYACDKCDYATVMPASLVQHKYKHSTEKKFKCESCPFASKHNSSLRFHIRTKHCDLNVESVEKAIENVDQNGVVSVAE